MKYAILMLILSSSITITMDFDQSAPLRRTKSASDIHTMQTAPNNLTVSDDDSLETQPSDDDHEYDSLSTQTSSEEDDEYNNDELARLAANTADPDANPHTTLRGIHLPFGTQSHSRRKKGKGKARAASAHHTHGRTHTAAFSGGAAGVQTREATYDDVVRQIQSSSRLALSEARTLNRKYLKAVLDQLQNGIESAQNAMAQDAHQAVAIMHDLQHRLVYVEKILPKVQGLLEQDAMLAQQYEQTCKKLVAKIQSYTQNAQENQAEQDQEIQTIREHMRTTAQTVRDIRSETTQILATTREMHGNMRIDTLKETFARYTVTAAAGGAVALLIMWCLATDHPAEAMEINDNLHDA